MCSEDLIERYVNTYLDVEKSRVGIKQFRDYFNTIDFAEMKGERKKAVMIARQMMAKSMPSDLISELTGLSVDEVEQLLSLQ